MVELEPGLLVLLQPSRQYAEKIIELTGSFLENNAMKNDGNNGNRNWISLTTIDCNSHWKHAKFLFGRNLATIYNVQAPCAWKLQNV